MTDHMVAKVVSRWIGLVVLLAGLVAATGCDSVTTSVEQASCVPGETRICTCPPTRQGTQICAESGQAYLACDCSEPGDVGIDTSSTLDAGADASSTDAQADTSNSPDGSASDAGNTGTPDTGQAGSCPPEGCGCTHFVSSSGSASADGQSPANAWSLEHALGAAEPGDTVCVAAGDYGRVSATITQSGTDAEPIRFFGYGSTPGDVLGVDGRSSFQRGDSLDSAKMPLLDGGDGTGTALRVGGEHVHLINFQITRYEMGLHLQGADGHAENIIATALGDQTSAAGYGGYGIRVEADGVTVTRSFVQNAGSEGIRVSDSRNVTLSGTEVYGSNFANPMGYYIILADAHDSLVDECVVYREPGIEHRGHGIDLKDRATNNVIRRSRAVHTSLEVNFSGVHDNLFEDCEVVGVDTDGQHWGARIAIFNGAHHNTFRNIRMHNVWTAINMADYDDGYVGPDGDRDAVEMGSHNRFENLVIHNADRVLNYGQGPTFWAPAESNHFYNSTFYNIRRLAVVYGENTDTRFINTVIDTVSGDALVYEGQGDSAPYSDFDVVYDHINISNAPFGPPAGTAVTTHPPKFTDAANGDLTLQADSALIDAGKDTSYAFDFFGNERPAGAFDLGAFERTD